MCMYSLTVNRSQQAKAKPGQVLRVVKTANHSTLQNPEGKVVCIKPGTQLATAHLKLTEAFRADLGSHWLPQQQKHGSKRAVFTMVEWSFGDTGSGGRYAGDALQCADGVKLHLAWVHPDVRFRLYAKRKVRKDKGVAKPRDLDKVLGLDQLRAEVPVKKRASAKA